MQMIIISCVQTNVDSEKKHSCETQLLETINDLTSALDAGHEVDVLFLDFLKAFDRVSHNYLLNKLLCYGINGSVHN